MKRLLLAALAFSAATAFAYSDEAVKGAEEYEYQVNGRFNVGEVTRTDVAMAHKLVVDMKYYAGQTAKQDYCTEVIATQETVVAGMQEEGRTGERSPEDIIAQLRELWRIKADCK